MFKRKSKLEELRKLQGEVHKLIELALIKVGYRFNSVNCLYTEEEFIKRDIKEAIDYFFNNLDGNTIYEGNSQFLSGIFYKQDEMYNYYDEYYQYHKEMEDGSLLISYCKNNDNITSYYNERIPVGQWIIKWKTDRTPYKTYTDKEIKRLKQIREIVEK